MNCVLVVGAGATLAQAAHYRPKKSGGYPPLDASFFERCVQLAQRVPSVQRRNQRLLNSIISSGDFEIPFESPYPSLEQYFADVYHEVSTARNESAFPVLVDLIRLYNEVIGETTNWISSHRAAGLLDKVIRREIQRSTNLTVITFNQDLVLENIAFFREPGKAGRWCLPSLYSFPDRVSQLFEGTDIFLPHNQGCPHDPPFKLLKLHGSLNWVVKSRDRDPRPNTVFPQRANRKVHLVLHRTISADLRMLSEKGKRTTWYLWPLIIPPIYEKTRVAHLDVVRQAWDDAGRVLREADRVVLIGYSIPDADLTASQLLRRAIVLNSKLDTVHCVNPDSSLVEKAQSRLRPSVVHLYDSLESYLQHGF